MRTTALAVAALVVLGCAGGGSAEPDRPYAYEVDLLAFPSDCSAAREGACIRDAAEGRDATCIYVPASEGRPAFFSWSLRAPCGPDACTVAAESGATLTIACPFPL